MSWSCVSWLGPVRTATGGLMRHKVQAVVIGMVLLVSTASATPAAWAAGSPLIRPSTMCSVRPA